MRKRLKPEKSLDSPQNAQDERHRLWTVLKGGALQNVQKDRR
jgi:hypothetical protein